MRKILFAAALTLPLGAASFALAQTSPPAASPPAPSPTAPPAQKSEKLSETQIHQGLQAEGYSDVRTLKQNGDEYQLQAKKGEKVVMLVVDARTGRYKESNG